VPVESLCRSQAEQQIETFVAAFVERAWLKQQLAGTIKHCAWLHG
jgi:hypothetical protein